MTQPAILICIFLRGGADGLNIVVPHGEPAYYNLRPTLAIPRPDDNRINANLRTVDLDGFFGLHPALAPLQPAWQNKHLAFVQACGTPDDSHSHFQAMELMERGVISRSGPATGWLGRYLALSAQGTSPFRAVSLNSRVPRQLTGAVPAMVVNDLGDFNLNGLPRLKTAFLGGLGTLYSFDNQLGPNGAESLKLLDKVGKLNSGSYRPQYNARYPDNEFGRSLGQLAQLIKADIGLEVACLDLEGWDSHFGEGGSEGDLTKLLGTLAAGLAAFYADMADYWNRLLVFSLTEFGRRVQENASFGTDHGQASFMFALGGPVSGGKVYGQWPGLGADRLVGPGDLAVTTDYRDVLSEIVSRNKGQAEIAAVFPGYEPQPRTILKV